MAEKTRTEQEFATQKIKSHLYTIRTMVEAAFSDATSQAWAEDVLTDPFSGDAIGRENRIANILYDAKHDTLAEVDQAIKRVENWTPIG